MKESASCHNRAATARSLGSPPMQAGDERLKAFAERPFQEPFAYLILDVHYDKVREASIVTS